MSVRDMYAFEFGSGSTGGSYLVPADKYALHKNSKGELHLSSVVPASCWFQDVKNLQPIGSQKFCAEVRKLIDKKPKK